MLRRPSCPICVRRPLNARAGHGAHGCRSTFATELSDGPGPRALTGARVAGDLSSAHGVSVCSVGPSLPRPYSSANDPSVFRSKQPVRLFNLLRRGRSPTAAGPKECNQHILRRRGRRCGRDGGSCAALVDPSSGWPHWPVLDLFLKVGTGSGVLEKLSSATRHRVIVLTNSASAQNRKRSLPIGVLAIDDKTSALSTSA